MDIKKIRALLLALDEKSMSRAALKLSYTPSALSHMADDLEAELGVKLIMRSPSGIGLTEEGERLYPILKSIVEGEDELLAYAKKLSEIDKYELRIGSYSSISKNFLPEIIKSFREAHPEIKSSLIVRDNVTELLENGSIDIAFASEYALKDNTDAIYILTDPYVAVAPKDAFANRKSVKREELYNRPYIRTNQAALSDYFDFSRFRELINIDSPDDASVISMVREGFAVTVLPSMTVKGERKGVRVLRLEPSVARRIGFTYSSSQAQKKSKYATEKFVEFLKKMAVF